MSEVSTCKAEFPEGIDPPREISVASMKPFTCSFWLPRDGAECGILGMKLPDICKPS